MSTIGTAYVQIMPSSQGLGSAITKEVTGAGAEAGKGFGGKFSGALSGMDIGKKVALGVAGVGVAAGAAGKAIFDFAQNTAATADNVDKMSQRLGLSKKTFQEMDFVMSQSGVDINSFQTGMKSLLKNMDGVTEGNKAAIENFEKLGVSVTDSNGNMRSQEDVLKDSIVAFQNMANGADKSRLAQELFGKQGQEMLPLLNAEAGSFEAMSKQANDLGLVMSDTAIASGVQLTDSIDQAKRSFSALGAQLGVAVMPIVQKVLNFIIANIPKMRAAFQTAMPYIQTLIKGFSSVISAVLPVARTVFNAIVPIIGTMVNAAGRYLTTWSASFTAVVTSIRTAKEKIGEIIDKIKGFFKGDIKLNIKLPKLSVSAGEAPFGIGGKGKLPSFSVKWAKRGYSEALMANSPSLIGIGDGNGNELITGERHLRNLIREESGRGQAVTLEQVAMLLQKYLPAIAANKDFYIDGTKVSKAIGSPMYKVINELSYQKARL